ncbi:MAG: phosphatidylserine decarboxylase [Deltaproteobacteria bacterium]|nr:phosphatidylserine decarboxylase [Deltaproteobacteria bacterium]
MASFAHSDREGSTRRARPGAAYSAIVGSVASAALPAKLRAFAYRAFARAVGANLDEAELELGEYASLGDFFARKLRDGARVIDPAPDAIVSPCDGVLAARGTCVDGAMVQAKGRTYSLEDLVADADLAKSLTGGAYVTIYLSPRDYHRVHTPLAGQILRYDYLPGTLWPVNGWATNRRDGLLVRNERVVIHLNADGIGHVAVVMVGAAGVGNIRLSNAPDSAEFRASGERRSIERNDRVERGDELGAFRLGSTVVLVFPPGKASLVGEVGQAVRFGERIGRTDGVGA